jgi:anti-sigma B factor antagonist
MKITHDGRFVMVVFDGVNVLDDLEFQEMNRAQLLALIEGPACSNLIVDLAGVDVLPGGMLELLASAKEAGREVEILNPSPAVQEVLRGEKLDSFLMIRGTTT